MIYKSLHFTIYIIYGKICILKKKEDVLKTTNNSPIPRNDFDSLAKQVLSYKHILAYVLKEAAWEYRDCSIKEIKSLIEPETKGDSIKGLNTEDTDIEHGRSNYDLLFEVHLPKGKGSTEDRNYVIINLEAHNPRGLQYSPVSRGVF